jgi:hypothetical protein
LHTLRMGRTAALRADRDRGGRAAPAAHGAPVLGAGLRRVCLRRHAAPVGCHRALVGRVAAERRPGHVRTPAELGARAPRADARGARPFLLCLRGLPGHGHRGEPARNAGDARRLLACAPQPAQGPRSRQRGRLSPGLGAHARARGGPLEGSRHAPFCHLRPARLRFGAHRRCGRGPRRRRFPRGEHQRRSLRRLRRSRPRGAAHGRPDPAVPDHGLGQRTTRRLPSRDRACPRSHALGTHRWGLARLSRRGRPDAPHPIGRREWPDRRGLGRLRQPALPRRHRRARRLVRPRDRLSRRRRGRAALRGALRARRRLDPRLGRQRHGPRHPPHRAPCRRRVRRQPIRPDRVPQRAWQWGSATIGLLRADCAP